MGLVATRPYRRSRDDHPLWIAGLLRLTDGGCSGSPPYPQLLHHCEGRDLLDRADMADYVRVLKTAASRCFVESRASTFHSSLEAVAVEGFWASTSYCE